MLVWVVSQVEARARNPGSVGLVCAEAGGADTNEVTSASAVTMIRNRRNRV
ncbi:hypothetical protein GCM10022224_089570 [Nonomuraea antimicrobica]|uniref:Uncharacterized protein n=1 Tax=Nonomuraea antimicrobica TaxID=561173 RepID=A0ABP7DX25_9ACTN